jgi:hypothetical protein
MSDGSREPRSGEPLAFDWQQGSRDVKLQPVAELTRTDGSPAVLIPSLYHENIDGKVYQSAEVPALRNWQKDAPLLISSPAASPAKTSP